MDDDRDYRPRDDRDRGRDSYRRDDRDRSRGHYSDDRDKRIGGSKERGQPPRGRSRSPSPRPPSSSRRRSASASRSRSRDLEGSRPRERRQRTPSPVRLSKEEEELLQLTRDARTVFVGQLVVRAGERDIRKYFEQVGPVSEVQLIKDKSSGRSKGIGYVEFEDLEAVPRALLLNGQKLCMKHPACGCSGFPLLVKPSEAEKNYAAMAEAAGGTTSAQMLERRAYAGNLGPQVTEGDLKALASLIAAPDKVMIVRDHRGASRGYAYMQFPDAGSAQRAAASLHGTELGGKAIKVGRLNNLGEVKCPDGTQFLLELGHTRGGHGGGGAAINAQARAALMQQLSSATTAAVHSLGSSLLAQQAVAAATASAAGDAALLPPAPPAGGLDIAAAAAVALGLAPPLPPAPLPRVVAPVGAPSPFFAITNAYSPEEVQDEDEVSFFRLRARWCPSTGLSRTCETIFSCAA